MPLQSLQEVFRVENRLQVQPAYRLQRLAISTVPARHEIAFPSPEFGDGETARQAFSWGTAGQQKLP